MIAVPKASGRYRVLVHKRELSEADRLRLAEWSAGDVAPLARSWLWNPSTKPSREALDALADNLNCDVNVLPDRYDPNRLRLLVSDMDSTMIGVECIDELALLAGCGPAVAAITAASMRGELDFAGALTERVRLLAGLPVQALASVYETRVTLNAGADELLAELRKRGIQSALVSGGFHYFANRVGARLGFDHVLANDLEIEDGRLTGRLSGPLIGGPQKAEFLDALCTKLQITQDRTIAVGDGANDIPMLRLAGLGVAYKAKPKVREAAHVSVDRGDLGQVIDFLDPRL